jgi:hypothetical protein
MAVGLASRWDVLGIVIERARGRAPAKERLQRVIVRQAVSNQRIDPWT